MTRLALVLALSLPVVAFVGCGGGSETSTVTVTETATTATESEEETSTTAPSDDGVAITDSGFSQDGKTISVGLVLENPSDEAALSVQVLLNLIDANGDILASDTHTIPVIPASGTYYSGAQVYSNKRGAVQRIEPEITVGDTSSDAYALPIVSNVTLESEQFLGLQATGELRNTLPDTLSSFARITAVAYDGAGKVLGGGYTFPQTDVQPGSRISFTVGNGMEQVDPKAAVRVKVSAANQGAAFEAIPPG